MNPQRYQQISDLFNRLRHMPASECGAVLEQVGVDDPGLRHEVEALLGSEGLRTMAAGELREDEESRIRRRRSNGCCRQRSR